MTSRKFHEDKVNEYSELFLHYANSTKTWDRFANEEKDPQEAHLCRDISKDHKGSAKRYSKQLDRHMAALAELDADPVIEDPEEF